MNRITLLKKLGGSALSAALVASAGFANVGAGASQSTGGDFAAGIEAISAETNASVMPARADQKAEGSAAVDLAANDTADAPLTASFSAGHATLAALPAHADEANLGAVNESIAPGATGLLASAALGAWDIAGVGAGIEGLGA